LVSIYIVSWVAATKCTSNLSSIRFFAHLPSFSS